MLSARSLQEARLFVDLQACDCGTDSRFEPELSVEERDGKLVAVYAGICPGCGRQRRFEFAVPTEQPAGAAFGGPEPSTLIDAGQYLWTSDRAAERAAELTAAGDAESRVLARTALETALAALDEALKLIPAIQDTVRRDQLGSDLGRSVFDQNPDRFRRERLEYRRELLTETEAGLG